MSLLKEPINRGVYDFVIKSPRIVDLFDRYAVLGQLLLLGVGSRMISNHQEWLAGLIFPTGSTSIFVG